MTKLEELLAKSKERIDDCDCDVPGHYSACRVEHGKNEIIKTLKAAVDHALQECPYSCVGGDCGAEWEMEPKPCPHCEPLIESKDRVNSLAAEALK